MKRVIALILTIAMIASLATGLAISASAEVNNSLKISIYKQNIYFDYKINLSDDLSKIDNLTLSDSDSKTITTKTNNLFEIRKSFSPEELHNGYEIILVSGQEEKFRTSTNIETYVSESDLKDNSLLDALYVLEKCAYYEVNTNTDNKISSDVIAYLSKAEKYSNTNVTTSPSPDGVQLSFLDMWLNNGSFRMYVYLKADSSLDNLNWSCDKISDTDIEYSTGTDTQDGFYLLTFPVEYNNLECTYNFTAGDGVSITISPMHYIKNVLFEQRFDGVDAYNNSEVKEYKLGQRDTTLALWNLYNKLKAMP